MAIGYTSSTILLSLTGLTQDDVVITHGWIFDGGANNAQEADFALLADHLADFFTEIATGGGAAVGSRISPSIVRLGGGRSEVYRLPDVPGPVGSPVFTGTPFTLPNSDTAVGLPEEVAYAQGYQGDLSGVPERVGNTRPASRRRGRFFVGPLNGSTLTQPGVTGHVVPLTGFRTAVRQSTLQFLGTEALADGWELAVWSRTDWAMYPAVALTDDNAFDTQRRRGPDPTSRTFTAFPPP